MRGSPGHVGLYRNTMSFLGSVLMGGAGLTMAVLILLDFLSDSRNPYLGIITFLALPPFVVAGLGLFLVGMWRESRRRRRLGPDAPPAYPRVDLNVPSHRRRFVLWVFGGGLLLLVLAVAGYKGFAFTESVEFCGTSCHVMQPEYVTYKNGPHARVKCVECHVGAGVDWYVKSKLSGVRQVFAVMRDSFSRPIPTPIHNLRPARDTCEQCHWPAKFFGSQLLQRPHFRPDERNTAEQISLVIKTGGGQPELGSNAGIHWHMVLGNQVSFIPLDERYQRIGIIRVVRSDGSRDEYYREDMMPPEKGALPEHTMDCIDCHNRPAHLFEAPETAVNRSLVAGRIARDLPWVKKVLTEALGRPYATAEEARAGLRAAITGFYRTWYPSLAEDPRVETAVREAIAIHERNVFPEMRTSWKTHPNNIGHFHWRGCFRCHDGKHRTRDGKVLTRECTVCHTMPRRGPLAPLGTVPEESTERWHTIELVGKHAELTCDRCHAVGALPNNECKSCHGGPGPNAPMTATLGCSDCHGSTGNAKAVAPCAGCHTQLAGLHADPGHQGAACTACHRQHEWRARRADCLACHGGYEDHYAQQVSCGGSCHAFGGKAPAVPTAPVR